MATSKKKTTKKKAVKKPATRKKVAKKTTRKKAAKNPILPSLKKGRGQPKFEPTAEQRKQVEYLVGIGMTQEEIVGIIVNPRTNKKIDLKTLRAHFKNELADGTGKVKARVLSSLYKKATSDSHPQAATCGIFLAKARYGLSEKQRIEHEVTEGSGVLVAPAAVTPEDFIKQAEERNAKKTSPVEE